MPLLHLLDFRGCVAATYAAVATKMLWLLTGLLKLFGQFQVMAWVEAAITVEI
jgi:hypothetical protein|tara:strand:+ start:1075 stop:1233 length:159 start_codon:yes stop_codon:yes gene_type:complete